MVRSSAPASAGFRQAAPANRTVRRAGASLLRDLVERTQDLGGHRGDNREFLAQTPMGLRLDPVKWRGVRGMGRVLDALGAAEGQTRYVGGAVRDELLGLPVNDVDLATRLHPDEVIRRLEK